MIRSNADFLAMVKSSTWLNARSVLLVGNGGNLVFSTGGTLGFRIPPTVKHIHGLNNPVISVSNFNYNGSPAILYYDTLPGDDCSIRDIEVRGDTTYQIYGFKYCNHVSNCVARMNDIFGEADLRCGFVFCENMTDCTYTSSDGTGVIEAFVRCNHLTGCKAAIKKGGSSRQRTIAFNYCNDLCNCYADIVSTDGATGAFTSCKRVSCCDCVIHDSPVDSYGFRGIEQISDCVANVDTIDSNQAVAFEHCDMISNCQGYGVCVNPTGGAGGWCYWGCSYMNSCKQGAKASTTAFFYGTNTKVDTLTVMAN